jgi:hypothetical protein
MVSQIAHIRTFRAIAQHRGFAAAARASGVSPTIAILPLEASTAARYARHPGQKLRRF